MFSSGISCVNYYNFFFEYRSDIALIILIVGFAKGAESISNIVHGYFQKKERMDLISISLIIRGLLSVIVIATTLASGGTLIHALSILAFAWIIILCFYDMPNARHLMQVDKSTPLFIVPRITFHRAGQLLKTSIFLGFVAMLLSLRTNIPRYLLEYNFGESSLGYFSALAYTVTFVTTIAEAIGQSTCPRLSQYYLFNSLSYRTLLIKLIAIALSIGILLLLIVNLGGEVILSILYDASYSAYNDVLILLCMAGALSFVGSVLYYGMVAAHYYRAPSFVAAAITSVTFVSSFFLVPLYGLKGAAWSLFCGGVVHVLGGSLVCSYAVKKLRANSDV